MNSREGKTFSIKEVLDAANVTSTALRMWLRIV
jgi:hypothetical protein